MTFDEARASLMRAFDAQVLTVRGAVEDRGTTRITALNELFAELRYAAEDVCLLNYIEKSAKRG